VLGIQHGSAVSCLNPSETTLLVLVVLQHFHLNLIAHVDNGRADASGVPRTLVMCRGHESAHVTEARNSVRFLTMPVRYGCLFFQVSRVRPRFFFLLFPKLLARDHKCCRASC